MPRDRGRPRITGKPTRNVVLPEQHQIELGLFSRWQSTRFENEIENLGGSVTWHRLFYTPGQTSSSMGQVTTDCNAGYKCYVSFRATQTWEQVAAGDADANWTNIGTFLGGRAGTGHAWCFNHEPENDRMTFGSDANGDAFVAAWERVASIIKPLAPNWQASICLFDEVFPTYEFSRGGNWQATPDPNRWMSSEMDLLGVDYYAYRGASDGGSHWATSDFVYDHASAVADFLDYADSYNVPLCFPEFSYAIKDPAGADPNDKLEQEAWLEDFAATWAGNADIQSIMWFEVNEQDDAAKANYALTDDDHPAMHTPSVQAFVDIGA